MTREQALAAARISTVAGFGPCWLVEALDRLGLLKLEEPSARVLHVPVCPQANAGLSGVAVTEDTLIDVLRKAGYRAPVPMIPFSTVRIDATGDHRDGNGNPMPNLDLSKVAGTLIDPTIHVVTWEQRAGGTIIRQDGSRQPFSERELLRPYIAVPATL